MIFLQPFILWALPLILLPVLIHFINRMRHRTQPWGAMRFLLAATRSSVSHAKLRQFLILLFRVLAVLMLVLFLSRPLAGGWLGWMISPAPDAILLLLDRSASMESLAGPKPKRELALEQLGRAAAKFEGRSHLVLIDSALRAPQQISDPLALASLSIAGPTDTAADIPALFETALRWLTDNQAGVAELWIASDLQTSNWNPQDPRWQTLAEGYSALPQKVRVRLLAFPGSDKPNDSLHLERLSLEQRGDSQRLLASLEFHRTDSDPKSVPLTVELNGIPSLLELELEGPSLRRRESLPAPKNSDRGWGSITLPADGSARDNMAYFVYGRAEPPAALVAAEESGSRRLLHIAITSVAPASATPPPILPAAFDPAMLSDKAALVWQGPLPDEAAARAITAFAQEGGVVLFLPSPSHSGARFQGLGWGELTRANPENPMAVPAWDETQGPLAKTEEGFSLPVPQIEILARRQILGDATVLAAFADGAPFLVRKKIGRGTAYFCATQTSPEWSDLGAGYILVPMLSRLLDEGSQRLQRSSSMVCGELSRADAELSWMPIRPAASSDIHLHAGIYQSGARQVAVNRPRAEDLHESIPPESLSKLLPEVPVHELAGSPAARETLQGEIWRVFLLCMLAALLVESLLILPPRTQPAKPQ